jgi:hypothetical protein
MKRGQRKAASLTREQLDALYSVTAPPIPTYEQAVSRNLARSREQGPPRIIAPPRTVAPPRIIARPRRRALSPYGRLFERE